MAEKSNEFMMLYFLIPLFNEQQNLKNLFYKLDNTVIVENKFYVFIDDCSTDSTVETINNLFQGKAYKIIEKEANIGPGDSFNLGFEFILGHSINNDDIVITMEGDNTSDIDILPQMLSISRLGFDLVLASVSAQGGGFEKTNFVRKIISFFANMVFRSLFGIKTLTLSSFYRVYKISLVKKIKDRFTIIINEKGFISMLEILIKAIKVDAKIIEVPMKLKSTNRKGKSKMKILKTAFNYLHFLFFKKEK
jgi:dolichol-phosphate mannosyltransferase